MYRLGTCGTSPPVRILRLSPGCGRGFAPTNQLLSWGFIALRVSIVARVCRPDYDVARVAGAAKPAKNNAFYSFSIQPC